MSGPDPVAVTEDSLSASALDLVWAAERIVAERGVLAATDQAIIRTAKHRNHSAIVYHFGSREKLLDCVWTLRSRPVNEHRARMLADLRRTHTLDDLRSLVTAHVEPLVFDVGSRTPSYWARFNDAFLRDRPLDFINWVTTDLERFDQPGPLHTLMELYGHEAKLVARGREPWSSFRLSMATRMLVSTTAAWEREREAGAERPTPAEMVRELVEAATLMLSAPTP